MNVTPWNNSVLNQHGWCQTALALQIDASQGMNALVDTATKLEDQGQVGVVITSATALLRDCLVDDKITHVNGKRVRMVR